MENKKVDKEDGELLFSAQICYPGDTEAVEDGETDREHGGHEHILHASTAESSDILAARY